jgi:hypothetical protein
VRDQKGKDVKYQVIAREGYTAKHTVDWQCCEGTDESSVPP